MPEATYYLSMLWPDFSDVGGQVEVDAERRGLRHDVSDLTLEAIEESCVFGEDCVLIGLC